ncbi:MAG: hypothetical protein Q9172_007018, partial [Xanthocarpia lactea]
MLLNLCLTTLAVAIVPTWAARGRLAPRGSPIPSPTYAFGTAIGGAHDLPEPTPGPKISNKAKEFGAFNADRITIGITNAFGWNLPILYNSNAGSPTIIGNPPAGTLLAGTNTNVVVPRDFA